MRNVGIFGIGCVGSVLVKYLHLNKSNKYFYFNRSMKTETKILCENNLTTVPIHLSINDDMSLDWLIVCLKEYHYESALLLIKKLIRTETKIVIFRNGLRLSSNFFDIASDDNILETIIHCSIHKNSIGEYVQLRKPEIIIPTNELADDFIKLFGASEIVFSKSENFKLEQWKKLIESASLGAIQTMTLQPCLIFKNPKWLKLYKKLIDEGVEVANSEGLKLDDEFKTKLLEKLKKYPMHKGSSMLSDKLAGRKIELEAKTGAIVKSALKNQINIPTTQEIYNSLLT